MSDDTGPNAKDRMASAAERSAAALESLSKPDPFKKWRFVVAVVTVCIATATLLWGPNLLRRVTAEPPATGSHSASGGTDDKAGVSPAPEALGVGHQCVSERGLPLACDDPKAAFLYTSGNCDVPTALANLGVEARLDSIDVTVTSSTAGGCQVAVGSTAAEAGATAADLATAAKGSLPNPALRMCARRDGRTEVSCARPHEIEYVGPWFAADTDEADRCESLDREYANRTLAEDSRLSAVKLRRSGKASELRCAIASSVILNGSIRLIGGQALPTS